MTHIRNDDRWNNGYCYGKGWPLTTVNGRGYGVGDGLIHVGYIHQSSRDGIVGAVDFT